MLRDVAADPWVLRCPHVLPPKPCPYAVREKGEFGMARKRHSDEDVLNRLREIELKLTDGDDVASGCRSVSISDAKHYKWRSRFGGVATSQ